MNYDVSKESIPVRVLDFEGCQEIPIDLDFSLPDYCPDIQRILKCQVCPNITTRNISGDRLNIEGSANIRLIYLDADNMSIRCCENSSPFSCSIDIKCSPENAVALTFARTEYINCRAVSPRKIDIHGAFTICAKIYSKNSMNIISSVSGKDIEQKIEKINSSSLTSMGQQQFSINETLETGENRPSPEAIIKSEISAVINDYKVMPNKIVAKGEITLKILYMSDIESGKLENTEYSIPISQIVDVPGIDDDSKYVINAEILSHEETLQNESSKNSNLISTDIKIAITVTAYNEKEAAIVSDVYSTDYNLETENRTITLSKLSEIIQDNISHKDSLDLPGTNISKIIDLWSDNYSAKTISNDGKPAINIKMNICFIALDENNTPFYIERILDFNHNIDSSENFENFVSEINISPISIGYNVSDGNKLEIKANLSIQGAIYSNEKHNMITSAQSDETIPGDKDTGASLTIYYASAGESLWDIARKYYTSVNAIKRENDISEDKVPTGSMLLIPMK